ncbi:MAG: hypothetical protein E7Z85_01005 [Methanosphaera stadtmanae]|nr:hypothetical protein [Methanosphaera stadtmanae]
MIDIFIAIFLGILLGIITGITPGLHVNTIGIILFSISDEILKYTNALTLCSFLVSISICHAMIEFIPSLLLGIPEENTILSIQPGHRLLFKGKGKQAIRLISVGGYFSIILLIILMPLLMIILPIIYNMLKDYIGYLLLITMICLMIFFNKKNKKLKNILLFLTSGIMGLFVLNSNLGNNLGLLALLSGLFSISNLLYSINSKSKIPPQDDDRTITLNNKFKKSTFAGSISGCILGLLPGLGPAQGTIIAQIATFNKNISPEEFLVTNSGVNISDTLFSLIAIYLINNPRSAISVYIQNIMPNIDLIEITFFILVSLISVSIATIISIKLGDLMIENMIKIEYKKLNIMIIVFISLLIIGFTISTNGCLYYVLICYVTSISLGILVNSLDLNKSSLMGVLIVPSIITYLGLS